MRIAIAPVRRERAFALLLDPGQAQLVGLRPSSTAIRTRSGLDVARAQADPLQHERHVRLVLVAPVALARDPRVASADRAARRSGRHERRARLEVAVAVLVADEPAAAGGTLEHREGIGPARLGPPGRAAVAGGAQVRHPAPRLPVDDRVPVRRPWGSKTPFHGQRAS